MTTCSIVKTRSKFACSHCHTAALQALPPVHRAIAEEAIASRLSYIPNDFFTKDAAEKSLFGKGVALAMASSHQEHAGGDGDVATGVGGRSTVLSSQAEALLFLRYNYARRRAFIAISRFRTHPTRTSAEIIARWYGRARDTRDLIARANLALVLAMAKRTRMSDLDFGEFVSEGNMALLRAIDKFDVARGFKFSTYACRAIFKSFARLALKMIRYRAAFGAQINHAMERASCQETRHQDVERDAVEDLRRIMGENLARLSEVEKTVLQARFALNNENGDNTSGMTLDEVGLVVGVTKERIRQIQNKALAKLHAAFASQSFAR